jgi:hypothetical protein
MGSRLGELPYAVPVETGGELRAAFVRASATAGGRAAEIAGALDPIGKACAPVLLKGYSLVGQLYRSAAERACWDVDLLFATDGAREAAREILLARGFHEGREIPDHHHAAPLVSRLSGTAFELHRNLTSPPLPASVMQDLLDMVEPSSVFPGLGVRIFKGAARALHHGVHALRDPESEPLLRNFFELAWMITRLDEPGRERLAGLAEGAAAASAMPLAMGLAGALFGSSRPMMSGIPPETVSWFVARINSMGVQRRVERLKRRASYRYIRGILGEENHGAERRPARVALETLGGACRRLVRKLASGAGSSPRRRDLPFARVGRGLMVHDVGSGHVHLLNEVAATLWLKADGSAPLAAPHREPELRALGHAAIRRAIRTLKRANLLQEAVR